MTYEDLQKKKAGLGTSIVSDLLDRIRDKKLGKISAWNDWDNWDQHERSWGRRPQPAVSGDDLESKEEQSK